MKNAKVIARTDKGRVAIETHMAESLKLPRRKKVMFKMLGYSQGITNHEPLTIEIELKNKVYQELLKIDDFKKQMVDTLKKNGAGPDDYFLEVE